MKYIMFTLFIGICIFPSIANAEGALSLGVGNVSCTEFSNKVKDDAISFEAVFFNWAQGYMTGRNYNPPNPYKKSKDLSKNIASQKSFIINYCNQHPSAKYADAVNLLYDSLPEFIVEKKIEMH